VTIPFWWLLAGVGVGLYAVTVLPSTDPAAPVPAPDPGLMPLLSPLARAIAFAEGYNASPTNAPTRANNPGSLKVSGYPVTGAEGISVFPTVADGWDALTHQLNLIASGTSAVYARSMTIAQMGVTWTDTAAMAWTANVVAYLQANGLPGVTADTPLDQVLG
jgi:hypothetical protein